MRALLIVIACCGPAVRAPAAGAPAPRPVRVPPALRELGRRHEVRLVYFVPADRKPTRAWRAKIIVVMTFVSDLYRTSLTGAGHRCEGLDFEFGADGKPKVHLVRGRGKAGDYNGAPSYSFMKQWRTVLPEVTSALGPADRHLYVIIAETYDPGPNRYEWPGGVALGGRVGAGGGVGLFSAWMLQDMFCATTVADQMKLLADTTPIAGRRALGAGRADSPRFEFIEDGFGAVAHELGHAVGLWHDHRVDGLYIMGNGFRALGRNYFRKLPPSGRVRFSRENTAMLAHTRLLADHVDPNDGAAPTIRLSYPKSVASGTKALRISAEITDDVRLGASVFFCSSGDSVVWGKTHEGRTDKVAFTAAIRPARRGAMRIYFGTIDRGGNFARVDGRIAVK